jgi:hypothetical protein
MHVVIKRSGGFAGDAEPPLSLSTETLATEDASQVEAVVDALFAKGAEASELGADLWHYEVTATTDEGERTLSLDVGGDPDAPDDPRLAELLRLARP